MITGDFHLVPPQQWRNQDFFKGGGGLKKLRWGSGGRAPAAGGKKWGYGGEAPTTEKILQF